MDIQNFKNYTDRQYKVMSSYKGEEESNIWLTVSYILQ